VNPELDGPTELSAGDVEVHYGLGGPVAAALAWAEMVLDGRLADAWGLTGSLFRLSLTRYWSWGQRFQLSNAGLDALEVADALSEDGPAHPLWPAFARSQQPPEARTEHGSGAGWVAAGPPEPVGPDLEVVRLVAAEAAAADARKPFLTLVLRLGPSGWLVAGHERCPAPPHWPPCQ
jgi:hypothetical protein